MRRSKAHQKADHFERGKRPAGAVRTFAHLLSTAAIQFLPLDVQDCIDKVVGTRARIVFECSLADTRRPERAAAGVSTAGGERREGNKK